MQRYLAEVKEEVNREARFEELQQLQNEIKQSSHKAQAREQRKVSELTQQLDFQELDALETVSAKEPSAKN
jgi:sec-independent protein translocase protein TatB